MPLLSPVLPSIVIPAQAGISFTYFTPIRLRSLTAPLSALEAIAAYA